MKNPRRKNKAGILAPFILISFAFGILGYEYCCGHTHFTSDQFLHKLLKPLLQLLFFLAVGLAVGQLVESMGWTSKLARFVRPITRWGHLKDESGAAFISSFVSGLVANSMLMNFYKDERITKKELILTYLLNNGLPVFTVHLPTTSVIVASLAGTAGLIYLIITFLAAVLRTLAVLMYTKFALPEPAPAWSALVEHLQPQEKSVYGAMWKKFKMRFSRIVLYTIPIYIFIFLANQHGMFVWLRQEAVKAAVGITFPVEAAGIVIFTLAAEFGSGMAAAGALLSAGTLTVKQTVIALIVGTIVSTPIRAIRHQLPTNIGLFEIRLGSQLMFISQGMRVISLILVSAPYFVWG